MTGEYKWLRNNIYGKKNFYIFILYLIEQKQTSESGRRHKNRDQQQGRRCRIFTGKGKLELAEKNFREKLGRYQEWVFIDISE